MLNTGVPVEAVKQKMSMDGFDGDSLDVALYERVQSQTRNGKSDYEEGKDVDPKYQKVRPL